MTATATEKTRLEAVIIETISDTYERYNGGLLSREPSITVTYLVDLMEITGSVRDFFPTSYRKMGRQMVQAACDKLVRAGRLTTSLGLGENGNETRCYEPGTEVAR